MKLNTGRHGENAGKETGLGIVREALCSYPQIELNGNVSAVINGSAGICEFEEDHIGVVVGGMLMRLYGESIEIVSLGPAQTVITGRFDSLSFDS
ncbi:MAG: hypothetical protein IK118_03185 [Clostridia bacterium]|nr:hypothetical protein [Clostridia bacterium]MBR5427328.1 hypothetical protein [Clostridia bacterium]